MCGTALSPHLVGLTGAGGWFFFFGGDFLLFLGGGGGRFLPLFGLFFFLVAASCSLACSCLLPAQPCPLPSLPCPAPHCCAATWPGPITSHAPAACWLVTFRSWNQSANSHIALSMPRERDIPDRRRPKVTQISKMRPNAFLQDGRWGP